MNADAGCLGVHDAGGSLDFGARDSLAGALERWRPDEATFSLDAFEKNVLQGRATVALGYVLLFGLQALVAVFFVVQPLLAALTGATTGV